MLPLEETNPFRFSQNVARRFTVSKKIRYFAMRFFVILYTWAKRNSSSSSCWNSYSNGPTLVPLITKSISRRTNFVLIFLAKSSQRDGIPIILNKRQIWVCFIGNKVFKIPICMCHPLFNHDKHFHLKGDWNFFFLFVLRTGSIP